MTFSFTSNQQLATYFFSCSFFSGLIFAVTVQLGRKALGGAVDLVFVLVTAAAVNLLHWKVPYALLVVGAVAIWWHRPRAVPPGAAGQ